ncbi:MAG: hypothetical protein LIP01_12595 [Tannerellaceae bacterium]|nr:hypothetical protein [Tannerellaceae bacterium]
MEMEDLKSGWKILNERLSQSEKLNRMIIQEMIHKKTISAYRKLFYTDHISNLLTILFIILLLGNAFSAKPIMKMQTFIFLEIFMTLALVVQLFAFSFFARFSLESAQLIESAKIIVKYQWWINKQKKYTPLVATIYMIVVFLLENPPISILETVIRIIVGIILLCAILWGFYYFYGNNLHDIKQGLKELEELEDDKLEDA